MSTSHFERKKWREDMVAFTEKTRGVAELFFYSREQLMAAVAAEAAGDEDAAKITQCFRQWILKAKHVGGALCLGCETRFKPPSPPRPEKFLVIRPFTDPSMVLIMG